MNPLHDNKTFEFTNESLQQINKLKIADAKNVKKLNYAMNI